MQKRKWYVLRHTTDGVIREYPINLTDEELNTVIRVEQTIRIPVYDAFEFPVKIFTDESYSTKKEALKHCKLYSLKCASGCDGVTED